MPGDTLKATINGDTLKLPESLVHNLHHQMEQASARNGYLVSEGGFWIGGHTGSYMLSFFSNMEEKFTRKENA